MTATEELASGTVQVTRAGRICYVVLNRPHALNALTLPMYDALSELCQRLNNEPTVRVVVFRGAGGRALAAGTDIAEFTDFTSGEDGVRYERRIGVALQAIEDLPQVTIAVIEGVAVGGGLALATACDVRVASSRLEDRLPDRGHAGQRALATDSAAMRSGVRRGAGTRDAPHRTPRRGRAGAPGWGRGPGGRPRGNRAGDEGSRRTSLNAGSGNAADHQTSASRDLGWSDRRRCCAALRRLRQCRLPRRSSRFRWPPTGSPRIFCGAHASLGPWDAKSHGMNSRKAGPARPHGDVLWTPAVNTLSSVSEEAGAPSS